jgi:hypothetical protein
MSAKPKKFFTKNGRALKQPGQEFFTMSKQNDICAVSSISDAREESFDRKQRKVSVFTKIRNQVKALKGKNIGRKAATAWASLSVVFIFTFLISVMVTPTRARPEDTTRYSIYASEPLTLSEATSTIYSKDSRAQRIDEVFGVFKCPMRGLGETFVYEADKARIPWWLAASIAFQESSCGKNTPKVDGVETYNAWGWGVYGNQVKSFESFEKGIATVSAYLYDQFIARGVTDLCEIMKVYTPPSNGSWCNGVTHFAELIQNYKTPQN